MLTEPDWAGMQTGLETELQQRASFCKGAVGSAMAQKESVGLPWAHSWGILGCGSRIQMSSCAWHACNHANINARLRCRTTISGFALKMCRARWRNAVRGDAHSM